MKKLVLAVGAQYGGALSNLLEIYNVAKKESTSNWIFVTSTAFLEEFDHITVIQKPYIKKSWIHRLVFDLFIFPKIIEKYAPDEIFCHATFFRTSRTLGKYYYYETNALFFTEHRFSPFESLELFLRQRLLRFFEFYSIRAADKVIVESDWLGKRIVKDVCIDKEKIVVEKHVIEINNEPMHFVEGSSVFFYPSSGSFYKNHITVIRAAKILKARNLDFKIIFTLSGDENRYIKKMKEDCENSQLPVDWVNRIPHDDVIDIYHRSILVFPSFLESAGLPLFEARLLGRKIICADFSYSRDAVGDYSQASFFQYDDPFQLAELMEKSIQSYD